MLFGPDDLWESSEDTIKDVLYLSVGFQKNVLYLYQIGSLYNVWLKI